MIKFGDASNIALSSSTKENGGVDNKAHIPQVLIENGTFKKLVMNEHCLEFVNSLGEIGVDLNMKEHHYGNTLLMTAIDCLQVDLAELLIKKGVDVNIKNKYQRTALKFAIEENMKNWILIKK